MKWIRENHGSSDHGFRREDNLAYVGRMRSGWWRAWIRLDNESNFKLLSREGYSDAVLAQADADGFLEGRVAA